MSAKPQVKESYFWQQVKGGLEDSETHLCRIENTAGVGISDINACHKGVEAWLELKIFHGARLHFRNSQRNWIHRRWTVGGRVFVIARRDDQLFIYDGVKCVLAPSRPESNEKSFSVLESDLPTPIYTCNKPFKWDIARKYIFGLTA